MIVSVVNGLRTNYLKNSIYWGREFEMNNVKIMIKFQNRNGNNYKMTEI